MGFTVIFEDSSTTPLKAVHRFIILTHPTRNENILDLFLIDNPTLVKSVEVRPVIADHDSVLSEVFIKPQTSRQKSRPLYKKADWEGLETHILAFQDSFVHL